MADQVNFGKLDFFDIRNNIIEFLKDQSDIKDYNFEGSIVSTLIDILAYNTLYYAYYLNMASNEAFLDTAQRVDSLVSLVKPLGYVIPGKRSASAKIKIKTGGNGFIVPRYTKFLGKNPSGTLYNFYTLDEFSLDSDGEKDFSVYEGKSLVSNKPITINQVNQKGLIGNLDIDLRSILVEVKKNGEEDFEEWFLSSNTNQNLTEDSKVYFLERGEIGFFVVFGGRTSSVTSGQIGSKIEGGDAVRVSYLVSNGSKGNKIGGFTKPADSPLEPAATLITLTLSSDGLDEPDLENIRFFAPKWFAAQDRAVTAQDAAATLAQHSYKLNEFNVWGGEEMDPPLYGRVFVSHINDTNGPDMVEILRSKTTVTVIPEYLSSTDVVYNLSGIICYEPTKTTKSPSGLLSSVVNKLNSKYGEKKMNRTYNLTQIKQDIQSSDSSLENSALDQLVVGLSSGVPVSSTGNQIHFRQRVDNDSLQSDSFNVVDSNEKVKLETYGSADERGNKNVRSYYMDNTFGLKRIVNSRIGKMNYSSGNFILFGGISLEYFNVYVNPSSETVSANQNLTLDISFSGLEIRI